MNIKNVRKLSNVIMDINKYLEDSDSCKRLALQLKNDKIVLEINHLTNDSNSIRLYYTDAEFDGVIDTLNRITRDLKANIPYQDKRGNDVIRNPKSIWR